MISDVSLLLIFFSSHSSLFLCGADPHSAESVASTSHRVAPLWTPPLLSSGVWTAWRMQIKRERQREQQFVSYRDTNRWICPSATSSFLLPPSELQKVREAGHAAHLYSHFSFWTKQQHRSVDTSTIQSSERQRKTNKHITRRMINNYK